MELTFGKKILNYRRTHNITIQELAQRTNLSTAIISQLERGIGNPTFKVLNDLAAELGLTLSELLQEEICNEDLILRKENRKIAYFGAQQQQISSNLLVESPLHTSPDLHMLAIMPHSESSDGFMSHLEEESLYVMEGEVFIVFSEDEEYMLRAGDSIRILPGRQHQLRNDSDATAVCINMKCKVNY